MKTKLELPFYVADYIVIESLKHQKNVMQEELLEYENDKKYLHIEDVECYNNIIECINVLLEYYGG